MQVKDVLMKADLKVVDPKTGLVGYYKGDFENGVFLGEHKSKMSRVFPIVVSKEDFLEWHVASDKEKVTIRNATK
jgi:hypothetical protein